MFLQADALAKELEEQNRTLEQQKREEDARRRAELDRADQEAKVCLYSDFYTFSSCVKMEIDFQNISNLGQ